MFERRLRIVLFGLGIILLVLIARLGQLQVVDAAHYRRLAEQALLLKPTPLPFIRGAILDRTGEPLVRDEPSWDLLLDYPVLAAAFDPNTATFSREIKRWKRLRRFAAGASEAEVAEAFHVELQAMWTDLAEFAQSSLKPLASSQLTERAKEIYEKVLAVRKAVAQRRGFDAPVAEESQPHAILSGLDAARQIAARERLSRYPWLKVEPSSRRRFAPDMEPFAHLLGRVGPVDADTVAADPDAEDPFSCYQADEFRGVAGVELAAERTLRGRRGRLTTDRDGTIVKQIDAEHGHDVVLTVHASLQRRLYELLEGTVREHPDSSGGAIVVLDVAKREALALVSYPSFDPNRFDDTFSSLRDDTDRLPLSFRAVASRYPPGSTIKPMVCLAGLMNGKITLDSREECTGYLFPDQRERWRCWEVKGTNQRMAHGSVDVVEALTGSCNVFMYRLGESLGVDRLCSVFDMVGIGRGSGIGLREDAAGINPTPGWLSAHKQASVTAGTARLYAIGQGELAMTPVQVANMMAAYAAGKYRPVTLIRSASPTPEWKLPASPQQWQAIRRGIYGVVNDPQGTAHKYVSFANDRFALCGKTGSATAHPWPTAYRVPFVDSQGTKSATLVREASREQAIQRFRAENPQATVLEPQVEVARRWPPHSPSDGDNFSHAWFGGFLQPLHPDGQPDWSKEAPVAFAVLVEFGGSGGQTSGPLATRVATTLLEILGPDLGQNREPFHP